MYTISKYSESNLPPIPMWEQLPENIQNDYSCSNTIPIGQWYINEYTNYPCPIWTKMMIDSGIESIIATQSLTDHLRSYDHHTVSDLYDCLLKYPIIGKEIIVIGSQRPWIEIMCICMGASHVTTVDYNPPICFHEKITIKSIREHEKDKLKYDAIFSFSSIEHGGLGRYGDPVNPFADVQRMATFRYMLNDDGIFFLGVPNGEDKIWYNAHRIYGIQTFPKLINGWDIIDYISSTVPREDTFKGKDEKHQPWWVLKSSKKI